MNSTAVNLLHADLTALVVTFNEAPNLRRTLERLTWAPRVIVLDSFSTDDTETIARSYPNVEFLQRPFDSFAVHLGAVPGCRLRADRAAVR
jgi:hypothetical protein